MSDTNSGDPIQIDTVQVVGGETTTKEPVTTVAEPPKAEETTKKEGDLPKGEDPIKEFKNKADTAHKQVIELIADKFKLLEDGRLEDGELRKWFLDHPEFSDTANRSKRMKDQYRSLMERSPEVRRGDKAVEKVSENEEVDDTEEKPKIPTGDKPVTANDLAKLLDERDERLMEKSLIKERDSKAETFAEKYQVVDDEYKNLRKNADALFEANDDWTYEKALEMALITIRPSKDKPLNTATPDSIKGTQGKPSEKLDLTKATPLMTEEEFFGKWIK